jgi:hypothetical protein
VEETDEENGEGCGTNLEEINAALGRSVNDTSDREIEFEEMESPEE